MEAIHRSCSKISFAPDILLACFHGNILEASLWKKLVAIVKTLHQSTATVDNAFLLPAQLSEPVT
jgi:hypothetical protein